MYVVFVETVSPQALLDTIQQTPGGLVRAGHLQRMKATYFEVFLKSNVRSKPNPAAQFPSDVPLLLLHSELGKEV